MRAWSTRRGFLGKRAVGRFLDERVLKVVGRKRDLSLLEDKPGHDEQVEGLPQLAVRHFDRGLYQFIGEVTPDRGPGLDNVLGRPQSVHPFHEQRVQTVRNGQSL